MGPLRTYVRYPSHLNKYTEDIEDVVNEVDVVDFVDFDPLYLILLSTITVYTMDDLKYNKKMEHIQKTKKKQ